MRYEQTATLAAEGPPPAAEAARANPVDALRYE